MGLLHKKLILFILMQALISCAPSAFSYEGNLTKQTKEYVADDLTTSDQKVMVTVLTGNQKSLIELPSIASSIKRIDASRSATTSIALAERMTVSTTSNSGVAPNDKDEIEVYVDASLIAQKPIYDGNRIALRTALSALETKTLLLDLEQQLNAIALDIARQSSAISVSHDIIDAIDLTLNDYVSSKEMLETLVNAGVVQKLEYLDLQQRVQGIVALRHTYSTKISEAESVLATKYARLSFIDTIPVAQLLDVKADKGQSLQAKRFELTKKSLQINKKLKLADKSWGTSFATSLTVKSTPNDPEFFSGLKFTLPIADGGQVDAALTSLDSQILAAQADLDAHVIDLSLAKKIWEQHQFAHLKAKEINKAQRELVQKRQIDLDRQLNAGRAKLDQVIANKLTLFDLEVKNIELTQVFFGQGLEVLAVYGNGCQAVLMCQDFDTIVESLTIE